MSAQRCVFWGVVLWDSCQQQEKVWVTVKHSKTWQYVGILFLPLIRIKFTLFKKGGDPHPYPPSICKTGTQIQSAGGTRQKQAGFSVEIFVKSRGGCWLSFQFSQMANKKNSLEFILHMVFHLGIWEKYSFVITTVFIMVKEFAFCSRRIFQQIKPKTWSIMVCSFLEGTRKHGVLPFSSPASSSVSFYWFSSSRLNEMHYLQKNPENNVLHWV